MNNTVSRYQDLKIWQKGFEITNLTYDLIDEFPKEERFALADQMRRSAVSIPSNIAEGYVRASQKELLHFLYISFGSAAELETQVLIAESRKYGDPKKIERLKELISEEMKMLNGFIRSKK